MKKQLSGFTLVEVMIVVAIAAILLAVAAPSFNGVIARSNIESLQDQFSRAVVMARTEAASRGERVTLCPPGCTGSDWRGGWVVVTGDPTATTPVLTEIAEFKNKPNYPLTVKVEGGLATERITFDEQGYNADDQRYLFAVCEKENNPQYEQGVMVEFSGRVTRTLTKEASLHNGSNDKVSKIELACT